MESYTFYIPLEEKNDEQMEKTAGLLEALRQNYGVNTQLMVRVETDKVFLVPMLKELQGEATVQRVLTAAATVIVEENAEMETEAETEKTCLLCGKKYAQGGIKGFCSKKCYNVDYGRRHYSEKKAGKGSALPNQAKIDENLSEEEARIERVVAKAKMTAPSANTEHKVSSGGAIMGRRL